MTIEYKECKVGQVCFLKSLNEYQKSKNISLNIDPQIELIPFNYAKVREECEAKYKEEDILSTIQNESQQNKVPENENEFDLEAEESIELKVVRRRLNLIKADIEAERQRINSENMKIISKYCDSLFNEIDKFENCEIETLKDEHFELIKVTIPEIAVGAEIGENPEIDVIINAENPIFSDIVFSIDKSKVKLNSQNIKQNIMSGATLGSSNMLDAINEQKFAVVLGRKTANLRNLQNQNHDCIDALVSNGLMGSPKIMSEYSVGKLLIRLSKLNQKMNFYIVHSALKVNSLSGYGISTYNVPRYSVGDGEILSVFFRYIAILFFPYLSITNSNDIDYKYDL